MDSQKEQQVKDYIQKKEETEGNSDLVKTVSDLVGLEAETKEGFFSGWLKNDKNLLEYANLSNKTEKLNIGESIKFKLLEIKLSITCPYFADFKEFLEELKRGTDTSTPNTTNTSTIGSTSTETTSESIETGNHTFCGSSVNNIESEPFQRNSKTGVTWCSKTAYDNGKNFGLRLPSGNAYDAGKLPGKDSIQTIPRDKMNKQPKNSWTGIEASAFKSITKGNYADIYTTSKSNYGHRAATFKDDSGQWYVLDPYSRVNGRLDNTPKKLEDYLSTRKIVKAHIYESKGYKKKSDDSDDNGTGYEWKNH